jgi:hypothetical protein
MNVTPGAVITTLLFSMIYKWAQYARVLHYARLERILKDKHTSILGPYEDYKENEVL